MIIELTGIPGAGKSTILSIIKQKYDTNNVIVDVDRFLLKRIPLKNKLVLEFVIFSKLKYLKKRDFLILKKSIRILFKSKNNLLTKINILRNILKKLLIFRFLNKKKGFFFIDEGVSHIPLSLFVNINDNYNKNIIKKYIDILPNVDNIIAIDADNEVLFQRVVNRGKEGHRRMNFESINELQKFMSNSRYVLEIIKESIEVINFDNNSENLKIDKILKQILKQNNV